MRVTAVTPNGRAFTVSAEADGTVLSAELPYLEGETAEQLRARVRQALMRVLAHQDREIREQRARRLHRALDGLEFAVERPWAPAHCELAEGGRLLHGQAAEPSHDYLLVLAEPDGTERERRVTTDRHGRFSVDLGAGRRVVIFTPIDPVGLLGADRVF